MNIVEKISKDQIDRVVENRPIPEFGPGDTLKVHVKVVEGTRERVQIFEGVCIARKADSINSNFTVRKISYGEGVERVFPLHSTAIDSIEVTRLGDVRRAKLYYLRGLTGKRARITEKTNWSSSKNLETDNLEKEKKSVSKSDKEQVKSNPKETKSVTKEKKASVEVLETEKIAEDSTQASLGESQKDAKKE